MTVLHDITFRLQDEIDAQYESEFCFRSRYVCNYIVRRVRKMKFRTEGFGTLVIEGRTDLSKPVHQLSGPFRRVCTHFDKTVYESLHDNDLAEFFITMFLDGVDRAASETPIPVAEIHAWMDEFRRGNYRNEWTHASKTYRSKKLEIFMNCSMDMERFSLSLRVQHGGVVVYDRPIKETLPDELIFWDLLGDVRLKDDAIIVQGRRHDVLFELPLASLKGPLNART